MVKGKTPCLLSRDWLDVIKLCWDEVFQIKTEVQSDVEQILKKYEVVFKKELGTVQGVKAKIYVTLGKNRDNLKFVHHLLP